MHNDKLLNNRLNHQQTRAYGEDGYELNSLGRDMGIDISSKGDKKSGKKKGKKGGRRKKPGQSSFGEADINESSLVVVTEEQGDSSPERKHGIKTAAGGAMHSKLARGPTALAFTFDDGSEADKLASRLSK